MRKVATLLSPRVSRVLVIADRALGAFVATWIVLIAGSLYAVGGAPKAYEMGAFGQAYAGFLHNIETAAHAMRTDFCAESDASVTGCASVAPLRTAPPPVEEPHAEDFRMASTAPAPKTDLLGGVDGDDGELLMAGVHRPDPFSWYDCRAGETDCIWLQRS